MEDDEEGSRPSPSRPTILRNPLVFFLVGLAPSWILIDGVYAQISTLDRSQPEGLALATYLGAVGAAVNTVVVPAYDAIQRYLQWPMRRWVLMIAYAQIGACALGAAAWHVDVGGCSIVLYLVVLVASVCGNGQQLVLLPWLADDIDNKRIAMAMAGGQAGALFASAFALLQDGVETLRNPSLCFLFVGFLLVVSYLAIRAVIATTTSDEWVAARRSSSDSDDEPKPEEEETRARDETTVGNPLRDPPDVASNNDKEGDDDPPRRRLGECCYSPFVAFRGGDQPWRPEVNAVAWSNAYVQLVTWVFMRSTLPYTFKALRPRSAGKDGGSYLSVAVNASYVACFLGSVLANRPGATANVSLVNALATLTFVLVAVCALTANPPVHTPAYAFAAILAAVLSRGLDGYCSPIFYRRIHVLSGSADLVRQAGGLAICVVMLGVWAALVLVLAFDS